MKTDPVKVYFEGESMWAIPVKFDGPIMHASLDNYPVRVPFNYGDVLKFEKDEEFNNWQCIEEYETAPLDDSL